MTRQHFQTTIALAVLTFLWAFFGAVAMGNGALHPATYLFGFLGFTVLQTTVVVHAYYVDKRRARDEERNL